MIRRTLLLPPDFQKLFESAPGLYLVLTPDPHFTICAVTQAYLDATKTQRDVILGRGLFEIFPDNPDDPEATGVHNLRLSLERVLATRRPDSMAVQKYDIRRPESEGGGFEERFWSPLNTPVFDDGGNFLYIIHQVQDVTEFMRLKREGAEQNRLSEELREKVQSTEAEIYSRAQEIQKANENLRSAHAELERLYAKIKDMDELKTQFFANVSHELRTPLTLILGPVEDLLQNESLTPNQKSDLQVIARNAHTLLKHVNDLLDVSKLEAGRMSASYEKIDLSAIVRVSAAHFETVMQSKRVTFTVETPDALVMDGDEEKIQRVVMNLVSNAFKFVPQGGWVKCSVEQQGETAKVVIQDNGPGVKKELREAIFERFRQGEGGITRSVGGTGLGLAIAKDFVELHHGRIQVQETPGGGATFIVELPVHAPPDVILDPQGRIGRGRQVHLEGIVDAPAILPATSPENETPPLDLGGKRARVLVVDDNPDMRGLIHQALREEFVVIPAADGEEGLKAAISAQPDLILTDLMMPKMSGDQMIAEIRKHRELDPVPIILLTAKTDEDLRVSLLGQGCQDYLTKPFYRKELLLRVRNWVTVKRAQELLTHEVESQSQDLVSLTTELAHRKHELQDALLSLRAAKEEAERASDAKSSFLSLLSHELNTPLTSMLLTLQIIKRRGVKFENEPNFERIISGTQRLRELIESLLQYSRLDRGVLKAERQSIPLASFVSELAESYRPAIEMKGVTLEVHADGTSSVQSDPKLLRMIVDHLLVNAIKFTADGTIELRVHEEDGDSVITVSDTGPGISREDRERIFEPFEHTEKLIRKGIAGLGLGLTLVKRAADAVGAQVEVKSKGEKGTTFLVRVPRDGNQLASW